jgi:hypothetical protein
MAKVIVKLAIAALVANAAWRIGSAYASFYRFKDSVAEAALYSQEKSDEDLRQRVLELAATYDVPLDEDAIDIHRSNNHTFVMASYTKLIDIVPGFKYRWPFTLDVDAFLITPVKLGDLSNPPKAQ